MYNKLIPYIRSGSMFSKVYSIDLFGMNTYTVGVEATLDSGMSRFDIVGLPDAAVSESR